MKFKELKAGKRFITLVNTRKEGSNDLTQVAVEWVKIEDLNLAAGSVARGSLLRNAICMNTGLNAFFAPEVEIFPIVE